MSQAPFTDDVPPYVLQCTQAGRAATLQHLTEVIASLTSCSEVRNLEAGDAAPAGCAPAVVDEVTTVQLLLAGILDPSKEIDKLQKEKVHLIGLCMQHNF